MAYIESLQGMEILDSRGRPTVLATCRLGSGAVASASVPSGASTGAAEALELRDGDARRYRGMGCRQAAANVSTTLNSALSGSHWESQQELDAAMIALDGTPNKAHLGANAILATSVAFARAVAVEAGVPLYRHLATLVGIEPCSMPSLTINLFSGGRHAGKQMAIQDVLVVPLSNALIDEGLVMMYDVYQAAAELVFERYGMRLLTADEGGLAPPFETAEEAMSAAVMAISRAGYVPGEDVALALDVASSHFYSQGVYSLDGVDLSAEEMIDRLAEWQAAYPLVSIEDGLDENDWGAWPGLCQRLGRDALIVGDDLLCTNPARIRRAIESEACNCLLLKVNQVGSLTEAAEAYRLAREAGWQVTISVRSGETEDNWAADLVTGWGGDQFKNGSITQSERLAKYNRLLQIEQEAGYPVRQWTTSV